MRPLLKVYIASIVALAAAVLAFDLSSIGTWPYAWSPDFFVGQDIAGKTLGIAGAAIASGLFLCTRSEPGRTAATTPARCCASERLALPLASESTR